MATVMISFLAGLFVGDDKFEEITHNLDLEPWLRLPKPTSDESTVTAMPGFASFSRDQRWCMLSTHTPRIQSH